MAKLRFTLDEIKVLWDEYQAAWRIRVLKDGKWELRLPGPMQHIDGTRAERVKLKDVKSFIEFLKETYDGN